MTAGKGRIVGVALALAALVTIAVFATRVDEYRPDPDGERESAEHPRRGLEPTSVPAARPVPDCVITGVVSRGAFPCTARLVLDRLADVSETLFHGYAGNTFFVPGDRAVDGASDAAGRFAMTVRRPGLYRLQVRTEDGSCATHLLTLHAPGDHARVRIGIPAGAEEFGGVAVHADGRAFRGRIGVLPSSSCWLWGEASAIWGETDEAGRFAVTGLHPGSFTPVAVAPGLVRIGSDVRLPTEGEYRFVVDAGTHPIAGRVVEDANGAPVSGAVVRAESRWIRLASARSDGDGRFLLRAAGRVDLTATARGFAPFRESWAATANGVEAEIRLKRAVRISGRVEREDGSPVGGMTVVGRPDREDHDPISTTSDATGRFELAGLAPGEVAVCAWSESFVSPDPETIGSSAMGRRISCRAGDVSGVVISVVPAARARGRVVGSADVGLSGVPLKLSLDAGGWAVPGHHANQTGASGADGRFSFGGLVPDRSYRVEARPGRGSGAASDTRLARSGQPIEFRLVLGAERRLHVIVTREDTGMPVPGARVAVDQNDAHPYGSPEDIGVQYTSDRGEVWFDSLPVGDLGLAVHHEAFLAAKDISVADAQSEKVDLEAAVTLTPGLFISGRVLQPDGMPAAHVGVSLTRRESDDLLGDTCTVSTDALGRFRSKALRAGSYEFRCDADDESSFGMCGPVLTVVPAGAMSVEIVLAEPLPARTSGTMIFRILDPTGAPVPFGLASIERVDRFGELGTTRAFSAGRLVHEIEKPGRIRIDISSPRVAPGRPMNLAPARLGPIPARAGEYPIRLSPGATISGVVLDVDGSPAAGLEVQASPEKRRSGSSGAWHATTYTDTQGTFRLSGLVAETYRVHVDTPEDRGAPLAVVRPGEGDLRIRLEPRFGVTLSVVDHTGKPVGAATVSVIRRGAESIWLHPFTTGADGLVRMVGLAPDETPELKVEGPDAAEFAPWVRGAWRPGDDRIVLEPARSLRGRALDAAGSPVVRARVTLSVPGWDAWDTVDSKDDGRFEFPSVPSGPLRARALPPEAWEPEWRPQATLVEPGTQEIVVTVPPSATLRIHVTNPRRENQRIHVASGPIEGRTNTWSTWLRDGKATVSGLAPDRTYHVLISDSENDLAAHRSGLRPGTEVKIEMTPGRTISGSIRTPPGCESVSIYAQRLGVRVHAAQDGDRYEIRGLAEGVWTVTAGTGSFDREESVSVGVTAGSRQDFTIGK